jgi:hypothetical protein
MHTFNIYAINETFAKPAQKQQNNFIDIIFELNEVEPVGWPLGIGVVMNCENWMK